MKLLVLCYNELRKSRVETDRMYLVYLELIRQLMSTFRNVSLFVCGGFCAFLLQNHIEPVLSVNFGDCGLGYISVADTLAARLWRKRQGEDGGVFGFGAESHLWASL